MLDQNTDRMWYVIGAVIIGAAIILILNKTFPQLFASVGEAFEGKTEQTTEVVDGIGPSVRPLNLLEGVSVYKGHLQLETGEYRDASNTAGNVDRTSDFIDVRGTTHVTISLHDVIDKDIGWHHGIVWGYDADKVGVRELQRNLNWTEPEHIVVDVSDVSYIRANLLLQDEYRYKIEKGTSVTPYE